MASALVLAAGPASLAAAASGEVSLTSTVIIASSQGHGGGVHLGQGRILTAGHVTDTADVRVADHGGRALGLGHVVARDEVRDLALVQLDREPPPSQLAKSELAGGVVRVGQKVIAAGSPSGTYVQVSAGIVSAVVQDGGVTRVQTDAAVNRGNSGGPLFDEDGKVLGIVVTKSTSEEGVAWATAAEEAQQFLAGNRTTADSRSDPGPDTARDATRTPPSGAIDPTTASRWSTPGALAAAGVLGAAALIGVVARRRSRAPLLDLSELVQRPTPVTPSGVTRQEEPHA